MLYYPLFLIFHLPIIIASIECPDILELKWDYNSEQKAIQHPNYYTFLELELLGGSTSNFNQQRNGGKSALISGLRKFLNSKSDVVSIAHSYTTYRATEQKNSKMFLQTVVLHNTAMEANQSTNAFKIAMLCTNHTTALNDIILNEMITGGNTYTSFRNITIISVTVKKYFQLDLAALIPFVALSSLIAISFVIVLTIQKGTNLELFAVTQNLFAPITIRRPEVVG